MRTDLSLSAWMMSISCVLPSGHLPQEPMIVGALGAALFGLDQAKKKSTRNLIHQNRVTKQQCAPVKAQ